MLVLERFNLCQDLHVFATVLKTLALDCAHVVELRLERLRGPLDLVHLFGDVLIKSISNQPYVLSLLLQLLLLGFDFHESSGIVIIVLLQLLQLSSLLEQGLGRSSALVFQDLLLLEVRAFGSLHELVSVVFVPHFQVVQSIGKRSNFLITLSDFAIEFISVPLELFLFLCRLDNVVRLGVLADSFHFSRTGLTLLD